MNSSRRFIGLLLSVLLSGVPAIWAQSQAQAVPQSDSTTKATDLPDSPSYSQALAQNATLAQATRPQESQPPQTQPADSQPTSSQPSIAQSQQPDSQSAASQQTQTQTSDSQPAAQQQTQPADQNPAGAATAQRGKTAGGAASRPAGAALAPAKQRNPRSLLIKLGLLAGAGVALGTAFALSQASPSRPPGAH